MFKKLHYQLIFTPQVSADVDANQRGDRQGDGARPVHAEDSEGA